jgi:tetratricopeptide (TPR) repeat protein
LTKEFPLKNNPSPIALALILVAVIGCGDSQPEPTPQTRSSSDSAATGRIASDGETADLAAIPTEQLDALIQRFNQGVGMMDRYQPEKAVAAFEEVVRKAPRWTTGRLNLGIGLLNLQQEKAYERAERELKRVIAAEPDNAHAHFSLGMLLTHLARFDDARPHFVQVLQVDPNDADAHYQLAVLLEGDDPAAARRHFETALEIMPHFESACYRLQRLLRLAGETEQAGQLLARFQTLKASGAGVTSGMKYGEMGRYANVLRALRRQHRTWKPGPPPPIWTWPSRSV